MCVAKKCPYKYADTETDKEGWIDCQKYLPKEYDLCLLQLEDKTKTGWHTGTTWDGLKLKESDTVLSWKRIKD